MESPELKSYFFQALRQEALFQKPILSHAKTIGGMRIGRMNALFGNAMKKILEFAEEKKLQVSIKRKNVRSSTAVIETTEVDAVQVNEMLVKEHLGYMTPIASNPSILHSEEDLTKFMGGPK